MQLDRSALAVSVRPGVNGQWGERTGMEFQVLGPLIVRCADRDTTIGSRRQRRLLTVLLVSAGTVVSTDRLADALWGDQSPRTAVQSLHTYISRLRALLHADGDEVLLTRPPGYLLNIDPEQTDAGRFERLLAAARAAATDRPRAALAALDEALALWRGPAYAEFADAEFARAEAMRLQELRLAATEERFDAELALGRHADLIGAIEAYADDHPFRERPRAQLMLALYRCGRHGEALGAFRAFRHRLDEDLGVEPSATLRDLETAILRQDAGLEWTLLPSEAAPPPTGADPASPRTQGRVPGATSSLVGRDSDVAAVAAALADCRLLTLTGMGGVGKTRLALRSATAVADRYPDGVWFCELAPVPEGADVGHALATAVDAKQQPGCSIEQSVRELLATRRLLLVVDNCEHVLADAARLVEGIVRDCPQVTVLATSRTPLGVSGECLRPTTPLAVPESDAGARATDSPSVQLFLDRARAVRPDLDLDDKNLAHIADVCRRLDGLPLSIELAAARLRSLNPADLAARLGDRFGLLAAPRSTMVARHRTLRAVVDWSYALLSPAEQRLLARLSVFAGGFTLAAAEQVCAEKELVDLLAALVDSSLVAVGSTAGQARYSMLDTLRAYGGELLRARGELAALRRAHAEYYAALAEQVGRGLRGPAERRWTTEPDADFDNLRAAHRWAVEQDDADLALRISAGLYRYVLYQFRDEVVSWGETALKVPGAPTHPLFPVVCGAVGEGLTLRGELSRARLLAERALAGLADPDDRRRIPVLKVLMAVALYEGRLDDCLACAGEQLRLARRYDDAWYVAEALLYRGLARTYAGDPAGGLAVAEENLRVATALENPTMTAWALYNRAEALAFGDPAAAQPHYERAITLAESVNSTFAANIAEVGLAALLARSGDYDQALRAFRRTVHRWHRMQVWHHQWTTLRNLVLLLVRIRPTEEVATLLGGVGAADAAAYGADAAGLDDAADLLERALGAPAFAAAVVRGSAMNADAVVAFALATIERTLGRRLPAPG